MPAVQVHAEGLGPVTIPLGSISVVRRSPKGTAVVVLQTGSEINTKDVYERVSERMCSVSVWGTVSTETVL